MNSWTTAVADTKSAGSVGYSGSASVLIYKDKANALVDDGAKLNQRPSFTIAGSPYVARDDQSVTVNANTLRELIDLGGMGRWKLNLGAAYTAHKQGIGKAITGGDVVSLGNRTGGSGIGGAFLGGFYDTQTLATIAGAAAIKIGRAGSLDVKASEKLTRLSLVQAGASTAGTNGASTISGSLDVMINDSVVRAGLEAKETSGPTVTGGGAVTIGATTYGTQINVVGTIVFSGGAGNAVGASVLVINNNRDVAAYIGSAPNDALATRTGAVSIDAGALAVDANFGGSVTNVVVAGVAKTGQATTTAPASNSTSLTDDVDEDLLGSLGDLFGDGSANASSGSSAGGGSSGGGSTPGGATTGSSGGLEVRNAKSGAGLAGAASVYIANDKAKAYINAAGEIAASRLSVTATNGTGIINVIGGAAWASGGSGGKSIAGAFAINVVTSDVRAFVANRLIPSTDPSKQNGLVVALTEGSATDDDLVIKARRTGDIYTVAIGVGVSLNARGYGFGGSAAANILKDDVEAFVDGATIRTAAGVSDVNAKITATNDYDLFNIAGGAALTTTGDGAVGAAIAVNWISSSTKAEVRGDRRRASITLPGQLDLFARNDQRIDSYSVGAAANTAGGDTAAGFTASLNFIDSKSQRSGDAGGIRAGVANADVTAGGLATDAEDLSGITSVAGGFGARGKSMQSGGAIGAAMAINKVSVDTRSYLDNARVSVSSGDVSVTAISDDSTELIDGKIVTMAIGGALNAGNSAGQSPTVGASVSINHVKNTVDAAITGGTTITGPRERPKRTFMSKPATMRSFVR